MKIFESEFFVLVIFKENEIERFQTKKNLTLLKGKTGGPINV
jgi:hypothetical protein